MRIAPWEGAKWGTGMKAPAARGVDDQRLPTHRGFSMQKKTFKMQYLRNALAYRDETDKRVSWPLTLLLIPSLKSHFKVPFSKSHPFLKSLRSKHKENIKHNKNTNEICPHTPSKLASFVLMSVRGVAVSMQR